jgi:predicted KAP-like P-loop ATPase
MIPDHSPSHFSADRPIRSKSEDLLGRAPFAQSLAEIVEGWTGNASLVMALYGPWGIGKSSIKNMMLEHLGRKGKNAPKVVEFNPWQWAAQDKLAEAFFREISLALGAKDGTKEAKRRAAAFTAYAAYLRLGTHLIAGIRPLLSALLALTGVLGISAGFVQQASWLKPYLKICGALALLLAGFTAWSAEFAEKLATIFSSHEKQEEKDLNETKSEVANLLRRLNAPILVVVDDVDRLTAEEVRLIFQLIKANADFPNLVYLVLCQRDIVEMSLEKLTSGSGKDYLEKIVQIGFDVPQLERTKLQRVLFAKIDEVLANPAFAKNFSARRWGNLFLSGLDHYFRTLRDVYRFLSVLEVQIARVSRHGSLEVNPIDLISLEVLRVFEPRVYHLLPSNKQRLTEHHTTRSNIAEREKVEKSMIGGLVDVAQPERKEAVEAILKDLFPRISGNDEHFYRELRVCHPDVFDRYFLLSIPEGDISQADLDDLLASTSHRERLVAKFNGFKERDLLATLLDRLEAYKQQVNLDHAVPFITALFDIGDDLPERDGGMFVVSTWMHAARIIRWYLITESDVAKRRDYLTEAIKASEGLYLPAMTVALGYDEQKKGSPQSEKILDDSSIAALKSVCIEKIRSAAASGKLTNHRHLATLLSIWAEWSGSDEPKTWVEQLVQSREGLISFLEAITNKSTSYSSGEAPRESWYVQLEAAERFADLKSIETQLEKLKPQGQNESEIRAIKAFREALERKRKGQHGGRPFLDWQA